MERPRIFLSAETRELASACQRIADVLDRNGCEPVWQDIFGNEPGDPREVLRQKIDSCQGFIQLIGDSYGAEPPQPDPQFGRCSYTQFEFLYACRRQKKTWLIFAGPGVTRDTPPSQLDPGDGPAAQQELQQLQRDYRQRPEVKYSPVARDDQHLESLIPDPRREFAIGNNPLPPPPAVPVFHIARKIYRIAAAVAAGLIGVLVYHKDPEDKTIDRREHTKDLIAAGKFTRPENLRNHLVASSERRRDADLAAAQSIADATERDRLKAAAHNAHNGRSRRIPVVVDQLTEREDHIIPVTATREFAFILSDEGVNEALQFFNREKPALLAAAESAEDESPAQTRQRLAALVHAADLLAISGDTNAARTAYRELLERDPAWFDALTACTWFLCDQSYQARIRSDLAPALTNAEEARAVVNKFLEADPANPDARRMLVDTLDQFSYALHARDQPGDAETARSAFRDLLHRDPAWPGALAAGLRFLCYQSLKAHSRGDLPAALTDANEARSMAARLPDGDPANPEARRLLASTLGKLGDALTARAQPGDDDTAFDFLTTSVELGELLLQSDAASPDQARETAASCWKLGNLGNRLKKGDPRFMWRRGFELMDTLHEQGMLKTPEDLKLWRELRGMAIF